MGLSTSTEQVESQSTGGLGALDLYDPYNPASPIYRELLLGAPVVLKAGLWVGGATPELATMFTGSVDSYDVDPMSGTVTFCCIDGRNKLRSLPFFREFRDAELWEVLRGAVWEMHARDENLLLEGEIGQAFFVIVSGQVKVVKDGKLLNVLKEGDCFGEMAYLSGDRARRSASIISVSEVQLLKIQAAHLESLSEGCQLRFNREFLRTLIERLTWTSSVLAQFRR